MAQRRGNREGTITQRTNGSWRAQIFLDGKRLSHTSKTRRECQDWLKKISGDFDAGISINGSQQTLQGYLESWLTSIQKSIRPTTLYQYRMTCRRYIYPILGSIKLCNLHPELIQRLYANNLDSGIGARTVRIIHAVLHSAFEKALKLGILGRNPVDATTPPRVESKEMRIYDENQVNQLLLAARGNKNEALYHLAIATGLRQSELLGLKWSDLDWQKRTLSIQRQLKRNGKKDDLFSQPKTKNGRRVIILGSITIDKFREHWDRQNMERLFAGERYQDNDLIFPTPIGTPKNQSNLFREFKQFIRSAGLPEIRFHDLRHTAASLLLNHNIAPIIVSRRLGHYKVSMTLDTYGHLIPEFQNEAAELIDSLITPVEVELHPNCTTVPISPIKGN
jgi:integrase